MTDKQFAAELREMLAIAKRRATVALRHSADLDAVAHGRATLRPVEVRAYSVRAYSVKAHRRYVVESKPIGKVRA